MASELAHEIRRPAGEPEGALILMHGRGVDQFDLVPLLDILDPDQRLAGLAPGGPIDDIPPGGRHWYSVHRVGFPDPATFRLTLGQLTAFLDEKLAAHGIDWSRTVIGGFSQGAVMAYACALGKGRPRPAGVLALSGFVPQVPGWEPDPEAARGLPVLISHGEGDEVIPVQFGRDARETLEAMGADVTYRETPMGHAIDPRFLAEAEQWVRALT